MEDGIDWKDMSALATVRNEHKVEGFLGSCVTEWYRTISLAQPSFTSYMWPYVKSKNISRMMKEKCPKLTFALAFRRELPQNLNFLEKAQVKSVTQETEELFVKQWNMVRHESRQSMHKQLNCIKWPKPVYTNTGEEREIGEGRIKDHKTWLEEKTAGTVCESLKTQRSIYWLHIAQIITPSQPFRTKMDTLFGPLEWEKIDKYQSTLNKKPFSGEALMANYMETRISIECILNQVPNAHTVMRNNKPSFIYTRSATEFRSYLLALKSNINWEKN